MCLASRKLSPINLSVKRNKIIKCYLSHAVRKMIYNNGTIYHFIFGSIKRCKEFCCSYCFVIVMKWKKKYWAILLLYPFELSFNPFFSPVTIHECVSVRVCVLTVAARDWHVALVFIWNRCMFESCNNSKNISTSVFRVSVSVCVVYTARWMNIYRLLVLHLCMRACVCVCVCE